MSGPTQAERDEVAHRFRFHPATATTGPVHVAVRQEFEQLADKLLTLVPRGRARSLALTALEEGMHWANAGVACDTPPEAG